MRRDDRHLHLLQALQDGRPHRAADLARRVGVSPRTIWRDMEALAAAGLPLTGTRGTGYRLGRARLLPPLVLDEAELEALRLGLAVVGEQADPELRAAARRLAGRLGGETGGDLGGEAGAATGGATVAATGTWPGADPETGLAARRLQPTGGLRPFTEAAPGFAAMPLLRRAIRERLRLHLREDRPDGMRLTRTVRPLRMDYLGRLWALTVWCELRQDFRVLRVERLHDARPGAPFTEEPGKRLADYLARFSEGPDGN